MASSSEPRDGVASARTSLTGRPISGHVQQHDHQHLRSDGGMRRVDLGWRGRIQGLPQVDPLRRPGGSRAGRPPRRRDGIRELDVIVSGIGLGSGHRRPHAAEHGHRDDRHQGRHSYAPQRLPPQEAAEGLSHGSLYGAPHQVAAALASSSTRTSEAGRAASLSAGPARPGPDQRASTDPAPREAEAAVHVRVLERQFRRTTRWRPPARRHRREPAPAPGDQARQRRVAAGSPHTRPQARQLVNHGHFLVNGRKVDIPSYQLGPATWSRSTSAAGASWSSTPSTPSPPVPEWLAWSARETQVGDRLGRPQPGPDRHRDQRADDRRALLQVTSRTSWTLPEIRGPCS